jgi:predicted DNA-binding protein
MSISLRLDDQMAGRLEELARRKGISKSELVRQCLTEYLVSHQHQVSPWELGKDLFGRVGSGQGDLSCRASQIAAEKMRARRLG